MFKLFREIVEIKNQVFESRKLAALKDDFIVPALQAVNACNSSNSVACLEQVANAADEVRSSLLIGHPFLEQLDITQNHIEHCFQLMERLGQDAQTSGLWVKQDAVNALEELQAWSEHDLHACNSNDWYEPYTQQSSVV